MTWTEVAERAKVVANELGSLAQGMINWSNGYLQSPFEGIEWTDEQLDEIENQYEGRVRDMEDKVADFPPPGEG